MSANLLQQILDKVEYTSVKRRIDLGASLHLVISLPRVCVMAFSSVWI